jgi:hypothetical protein
MKVRTMINSFKWVLLGLLLTMIFIMTMMKSPEEITIMLSTVTNQLKFFSAIVHILFLVVIVTGLIFKKIRGTLFFLFIAFLSFSATVISVKYMILPNIIIFAMFFGLIINAYFKKQLNFEFENLKPVNFFFGIIGMVFGFWYLHWVESPVWLNAFFKSPMGVVNCPTMVTICSFLCLTVKPRSVILETTVALITLYFGFFGVFRLRVYVDIVLIICALFLVLRLGSYLAYEKAFEKKEGALQGMG